MRSMGTKLRKLASPLPVFAIVLGAAVGLLGGSAFSAEITCSHLEIYCQGTNGADTIQGWENQNDIAAREGRDSAFGYGGLDELFGENDADNLNGGEGSDFVFGDYGNDSYFAVGSNKGVYGQSGADNLYGGHGEDFLEGNAGNDNMYGNEDADVFFAQDGTGDYVNGNETSSGKEQPCYVDGYDTWTNCTPH